MLKLVILGDPVSHSLSPRIHTAALAAARIAGTYEARRVDAAGMEAEVGRLRAGDLDGANVTMPHKALAARLADDLSPEAARAGSVNTLSRHAGRVRGDTTDVGGIRHAWGALPGERALILGSGGAAAAALLALEGRDLFIGARDRHSAESLRARTGVEAHIVAWGAPVLDAVVVNATPLGMDGEHLPTIVLEQASGLFDMVYGAVETPAIRHVARNGKPVVDGLEMLVAQAALSFEIWTGVPAPTVAMRTAAGAGHARRLNH
jgi:shikimate dehydrogenase